MDITRLAGGGTVERPGYPAVEEQYRTVAARLKEIQNTGVIIADDVFFSGSTVIQVCNRFMELGVPIGEAYGLVGIDNQEYIQKLAEANIIPIMVITYECLMDEICSRDFVYAMSQSGRLTQISDELRVFRSYFEPFGDPDNASIPKDRRIQFSRQCIKFSMDFWSSIDEIRSKFQMPPMTVTTLPYEGKPFVPPELQDEPTIVEILQAAEQMLQTDETQRE